MVRQVRIQRLQYNATELPSDRFDTANLVKFIHYAGKTSITGSCLLNDREAGLQFESK